MKNYQKIYNRLIKEIKHELDVHESLLFEQSENLTERSNEQLIEFIENKYGVAILNWILSLLPEIEGKECQMIIMNTKEFSKWKKGILK